MYLNKNAKGVRGGDIPVFKADSKITAFQLQKTQGPKRLYMYFLNQQQKQITKWGKYIGDQQKISKLHARYF